jgi:cation diffusion facilitator family transporter
MKFPKPLPVSESVYEARRARVQAITRVAIIGIVIRLSIVALELTGFFLFNSMTLLLDSLSTLADCVSSALLVVSIKLASRPPDENHPFGHGRYEPLMGLQLGIFLGIAGAGMFVQQLFSLGQASHAEVGGYSYIFALIAALLLEFSFRRMKKIAEAERSQALMAEAYHFRADGLNSFFAVIALGIAALFPEISFYADRIGAIVIALCMCSMGIIAAKKNLNQLLDRVPESTFFVRVRKAAMDVAGVRETEKIRIQHYGPDAHVDIDVEVDPHLTVEEAHTISQHVRSSIQHEWPNVQDVTVHIEPYYEGDH